MKVCQGRGRWDLSAHGTEKYVRAGSSKLPTPRTMRIWQRLVRATRAHQFFTLGKALAGQSFSTNSIRAVVGSISSSVVMHLTVSAKESYSKSIDCLYIIDINDELGMVC